MPTRPIPNLWHRFLILPLLSKLLIFLSVFFLMAAAFYLLSGTEPTQLMVSNITDQKVTLTFLTRNKERGRLWYSPLNNKDQPNQIKEETARKVHSFELTNLAPDQEYEYVIQVGLKKERGRFQTAPLIEDISAPHPLFGQIYQADGETPSVETLLVLQLESPRHGKSSLLTTTPNSQGMYSFDLGNLRESDLKGYFAYQNADLELIQAYEGSGAKGTLWGKVGLDQPLPPLILGDSLKPKGESLTKDVFAQGQTIPTEPPDTPTPTPYSSQCENEGLDQPTVPLIINPMGSPLSDEGVVKSALAHYSDSPECYDYFNVSQCNAECSTDSPGFHCHGKKCCPSSPTATLTPTATPTFTPTPTTSLCLYLSFDACTASGECSGSYCTGSGDCWYCAVIPTPISTSTPTPTPISQCENEGSQCRDGTCAENQMPDGIKGCNYYDQFGGRHICCRTITPTPTPTTLPTPTPDPNAYFSINLDGIVTGVYQGVPFGVDRAMVVTLGEVTLTNSTGYFQFNNLRVPDPDNNGEERIGVVVNKEGFEETPVSREILVRPNQQNRIHFFLTMTAPLSPTPIPTPDPNAPLCVQTNQSCQQYELCTLDSPNQYYCTGGIRCCWAKELIVRLNGRLIDSDGQVVNEEQGYNGPVRSFEINGTLWNGQTFRQWRTHSADRGEHEGPLAPWSILTDWGFLPGWQDARVRPGETFTFTTLEIQTFSENEQGQRVAYPRSGANTFTQSYLWNAPSNGANFWEHDRVVTLDRDFYITAQGATPLPTLTPTPTLSPTPTRPITPSPTSTPTPSPGPPIRLAGRVIDQRGNPVADVDIAICDPLSAGGDYACQQGNRYVIAQVNTKDNPQGLFSIDVPQSGPLIIRVSSPEFPDYAPQQFASVRYDYFRNVYNESRTDLTLPIGINFVLPYSEEEYAAFKNFGFNAYPVNTFSQAWTLNEVSSLQAIFADPQKIPPILWETVGAFRIVKDPSAGGGGAMCAEISQGLPEIRIRPDKIFNCFTGGAQIIWVHELIHLWHYRKYGAGFIDSFHKRVGLKSAAMNDWLPACTDGSFRRGDDCCSTPQGDWCKDKACWRGSGEDHGLDSIGECLAVSGADWYLLNGGSFANYFPEAYNWVDTNIYGERGSSATGEAAAEGPRDAINTDEIPLRVKVIDQLTGEVVPNALISFPGTNSLIGDELSFNWIENGLTEVITNPEREIFLTVWAEGYQRFSASVEPTSEAEQTLIVALTPGDPAEEGGSYQLINHVNLYLLPGWNLVSIPVQPDSSLAPNFPLTVGNLASLNNLPGLMATRWVNGQWDSYVYGLAGSDFTLSASQAVMIKSSQPQVLSMEGNAINEPIPLNLSKGMNLISIPFPTGKYTAESLLDAINTVAPNAVTSVIDFESGLYQTFTKENGQTFGADFPIFPKQGYFIQAEEEVTFTP